MLITKKRLPHRESEHKETFSSLNTANSALLVKLLILSLLYTRYDVLQLEHDTVLVGDLLFLVL